MTKRKIIAIINIFSYVLMITVNVLAKLLPIGGKTTAQLSVLNDTLITPVGLTFSIWVFIYVFLLSYLIYQLKEAFERSKIEPTIVEYVGPWFIISSLLNIGWILAWHYQKISLSLLALFLLMLILMTIYYKLDIGRYHPSKKVIYRVDLPFSLYLGWISIALILNVAVYLKSIKWDGFFLDGKIWSVVVIGLITLLGHMFLRVYNDIFYGGVMIFAVLGIYLRYHNQWDTMNLVLYACIASGVILGTHLLYKIIRQDIY